jgi:lipid-binding SYLF domain-containing protein
MFAFISRGTVWLVLFLSLAGCASTPKPEDAQSTVRDAQATLQNFRNDPEMKWFRDNVGKAKAIIISPRIVKAGFVIGGSGGKAVTLARDANRKDWAGPAFYTIAAATVGFQAGVEASEMVALVMTEKALNSLLSTSFKLGGDVSIAAGPVGAGASVPITTDVVAFTRSKGLYGGLNLEGTVITVDDAANRAYYGRDVTPVEVLIKRTVRNPQAAPLLKALAEIAPG